MDTGIAMLFAGIAAWAIGYGPVEVLLGQTVVMLADYAGKRAIDWYTA